MSTKQSRKKKLKRITRKASKAVAEEVRKREPEYENPEDCVEVALLALPGALLKAILSEVEIRKERRKPIPKAVREAVLERDGHRCVVGRHKYKGTLDLHHYKPVSEGGANSTGNLVTLCPNHHRQVHEGRIKLRKPKRVPVKRERA